MGRQKPHGTHRELLVLVAAWVLSSPGWTTAEEHSREATEALKRGAGYVENVEYDQAIAALSEAIRLDPRYAEAYFQRGNALLGKGWSNRAIADYSEAVRISPELAKALNNRGEAYRDFGDSEKALADFNEAIRLDPRCGVAYAGRGAILSERGDRGGARADWELAVRLCSQAVGRNPKDARAYAKRAYAYLLKGDLDNAIAD